MANPLDLAQMERTALLIEKGPQSFIAAAFFLTSVFLLLLIIRGHRQALKREREHTNEIRAILDAERIRDEGELKRAVKLELVVAAFTEKMAQGMLTVKPGRKVRQTADPAAPDAPTVTTVLSVKPERPPE
jgi:hypothetical protein